MTAESIDNKFAEIKPLCRGLMMKIADESDISYPTVVRYFKGTGGYYFNKIKVLKTALKLLDLEFDLSVNKTS